MRLVARPVPSFVQSDGDERVLVDADATGPLWLAGVVAQDEVTLLGAFDASLKPAERWLAKLEEVFPVGLELIGLYVPDCQEPSLPHDVPRIWRDRLWLLATRGEDGGLIARDLRTEGGSRLETTFDGAAFWAARTLVRGQLRLFVPGPSLEEAAGQLQALGEEFSSQLRFAFPGSDALPTLEDLQAQKESGALPPTSGRNAVSVEVLAEALGSAGPTNFVQTAAARPIEVVLDFAAYVAPARGPAAAAAALIQGAQRQVKAAAAAEDLGSGVFWHCFWPSPLAHVVCIMGSEDPDTRSQLHQALRLPAAPLLRPECTLPWGNQPHPRATGKPICPHLECGQRPSWWKGGQETKTILCKGLYEYSHYMQDRFDDNGWGCAYRSLQTCVSWYRLQFYSSKEVPGIIDIQRLLKRIDDGHKDLEVGSKEWIGTVEGMYLLQDYLGVECRMLYCQSPSDMVSQMPQVLQHLGTVGTPVMMGAGQYAYTLVGVCYDEASGEAAFLIADPHFTGADELKNILQKGWVGWKNLDFFEKATGGGFINLCLPLLPQSPDLM